MILSRVPVKMLLFLTVCVIAASALPARALTAPPQAETPPAPPTAAEKAFRDAWWAESGQGDLDQALRGYLAAVQADGPEKVRARALLAAGSVQQRLGKVESAIATFQQLLRDFAGQTDLVEQARVHLREVTAVDLREGYDEWYERRLFSEAVQVEILGHLTRLAGLLDEQTQLRNADERNKKAAEIAALKRALLAYGKGAVPALRKAAESASEPLAVAAIELLFQLGQLPPV